MLTLVQVCRVARGARFRQSVDRNSFRSPRGACDSGSVQPRPIGSTSMGTAINSQSPSAPRPVGYSRFIAVLRYIDPRPGLPCRARSPPLAECRPKFISVTAWSVRFRECSTSSIRFNPGENCYNSTTDRYRLPQPGTDYFVHIRAHPWFLYDRVYEQAQVAIARHGFL